MCRHGKRTAADVCCARQRRLDYYANRKEELARARERYAQDPEYFRRKTREWRRRNVDTVRESRRLERISDPQRFREYERRYAQKYPEKFRAKAQKRRALEAGADGTHTAEQVLARGVLFGSRCWMCGGSYEHDDHVIPLSGGGTNWPANLRPTCGPCNTGKGPRRVPLSEQRRLVRRALGPGRRLP